MYCIKRTTWSNLKPASDIIRFRLKHDIQHVTRAIPGRQMGKFFSVWNRIQTYSFLAQTAPQRGCFFGFMPRRTLASNSNIFAGVVGNTPTARSITPKIYCNLTWSSIRRKSFMYFVNEHERSARHKREAYILRSLQKRQCAICLLLNRLDRGDPQPSYRPQPAG